MANSSPSTPRLAIVVSRFNTGITEGLLAGAQTFLREAGQPEAPVIEAPGAFEIPLIAQKLVQRDGYEGVICLGAVIKGGTVSVVDPAGERHAFEVSDGFISFDFNKLTVAVERGRDVVRTEGPGIE